MDEKRFIRTMIARANGDVEHIERELELLRQRIAELERTAATMQRRATHARNYANRVEAVGHLVIDGEMDFGKFVDALATNE